jgi:hypothetical protein
MFAAHSSEAERERRQPPTVIVNLDIDDATAVVRYLVANNHDVKRYWGWYRCPAPARCLSRRR